MTTVENIENAIGVHEYTGHGVFNYGDKTKTHYKAYELQFSDPSWNKTTLTFKKGMVGRYNKYLYDENIPLYNKMYKSLEKFYMP